MGDLYSPRVAGPLRYLLLRLYRLEQLDEPRGQIAVLVIAVACRPRHSDGEAADPTGCGKVARPKSELVAELAIYLGVTDKADAVAAVADRADTIGAGYAEALPRIVVDEGAVLLGLLLVHKGHVVVLLILSLPLVFYSLPPGAAGTAARNDRSRRCLQPVGEVGHADAERSRIVIATGATIATRAEGTHDVVVGEGDVHAVLGIERHLEEIGQLAISASSQPSGRNRAAVDDMIAGDELCERRGRGMAVHRLQYVDVPLCPLGHAGGGPVRASTVLFRRVAWLHHLSVIRITGSVGSQPSHHHVAVGVGSHPGEDIGFAPGRSLIDLLSRSPSLAVVARRCEKDIAVIGPHRIEKAKLIRGQCGEDIGITRPLGAGVDLVVGEHEHGHAELRVNRDAHVCGTHRLAEGVFREVVRRHEELVQVAAAGAAAVVDPDLCCEVRGGDRRYGPRCR